MEWKFCGNNSMSVSEGGLWSSEKRATELNLSKVSEKVRDGLSAWTVWKGSGESNRKGFHSRGFHQLRVCWRLNHQKLEGFVLYRLDLLSLFSNCRLASFQELFDKNWRVSKVREPYDGLTGQSDMMKLGREFSPLFEQL
jgi:hypothetical protein